MLFIFSNFSMTNTDERKPPIKKKTSTAKIPEGAKVIHPSVCISVTKSAVLDAILIRYQ